MVAAEPALAPPSTPRSNPWFYGAGLDTCEGCVFVQERLAAFGKFVFLVSFGFFSVVYGLYGYSTPVRGLIANPRWQSHMAGSGAAMALWLVCRWGRRSTWALNLLDAGGLLLFCLRSE